MSLALQISREERIAAYGDIRIYTVNHLNEVEDLIRKSKAATVIEQTREHAAIQVLKTGTDNSPLGDSSSSLHPHSHWQ